MSPNKQLKNATYLSHGVWYSSRLRRLVLHLPSKCYCITGYDCSTTASTVYIRTAPNDGRPDPIRDPGPSPAQGHGAFGQGGVQPTAQTPNTNGVFSRVSEISRTTRGVCSI